MSRPSRSLSLRTQVGEAITDLSSRAGRTMLLIAAIALSIGAMAAGVSLGQATASQVGQDLAESILDTVTVSAKPMPEEEVEGEAFGDEVLRRVEDMPLVECSGPSIELNTTPTRLGQPPQTNLMVFGATSGYLCARGVPDGLGLSQLDLDPPLGVAVLGASAADALGVPGGLQDGTYLITVSDREYTVAAVLEPTASSIDLGVIIPYAAAREEMGTDHLTRLVIRAEPGGGGNVSRVVRSVVSPTNPERYEVTYVNDIEQVRGQVGDQLGRLIIAVGGALTVVTTLLVASSMANTVAHKTAEIGLRRALGYSRRDITVLFLTEGGILGLLGGIVGTALGYLIANVAAVANQWTPQFPAFLWVAGPVLATALGALATLIPALKAARTPPAGALRIE